MCLGVWVCVCGWGGALVCGCVWVRLCMMCVYVSVCVCVCVCDSGLRYMWSAENRYPQHWPGMYLATAVA